MVVSVSAPQTATVASVSNLTVKLPRATSRAAAEAGFPTSRLAARNAK
jgi:hypothetical protein